MHRNLLILFLAYTLVVSGCTTENDMPAVSDQKVGRGSANANQMESPSATGYLPIFKEGLPQNIISSRMEKNFENFRDKVDKSDLVHFPSAGLLLYPPAGSERSEKFNGFEKPEATILIWTNPFSMKNETMSIVRDIVKAPDSRVLFTKTITVDGKEGIFYTSEQQVDGKQIAKFTSAFGDEAFSWIITGTFPSNFEEDFGEEFLKSVFNAQISDVPRLPPGQDVDFTMRSNRLVLSDGFLDKLVFTKDGILHTGTVREPIFQAGLVSLKSNYDDRKELARTLVNPSPAFQIEVISSEAPVTIDGLKGYEFVSVGNEIASEEPLQLYSVILFDGENGYLMHGWVSSDGAENHITEFRSIANSFERRSIDNTDENDSSGQLPKGVDEL